MSLLQQHVAEAFGECNDTRKLLIEWRDARQAIFDQKGSNTVDTPALFARLAEAEQSLMTYAKQYQPRRAE